jgi:tRNA (cmo5U34)-methyltransferase
VLDIGCGAGNNTIKLRQALSDDFAADLLDLSEPMLVRARERVSKVNGGQVRTIASDFRGADLSEDAYDVILAAAVLHHLRDDADWHDAFSKIYRLLRPGGSVWITDLVMHETTAVHEMMWARYGDYLTSLKDADYRDKVFEYIDREDSPRAVTYQLDLLRSVGFAQVELLHKNSCFAAFGAVKGS